MREILGVLVPFFAIVVLGYGAARFRLIWQSGVFSTAILSSTVVSVATLAFVVWLLARPS
jgi:predicted permease